MPETDRSHYGGSYRRRAAVVRAAAVADPLTRCRRCGGLARPGDPWQAGHTVDGDSSAALVAEHRSCNTSAGARLVNGRRMMPVSRVWY
jgi:hypothetical protein